MRSKVPSSLFRVALLLLIVTNPGPLVQTSQVGVFVWIKSTDSLAGLWLNSEPQNFEGWNHCAFSFKSIKTNRIPYFDIRFFTFV
jgi:hypothetical protein